jgi:hypothetical protein
VKPYVVATGAILADAPYVGGIGGGLTLHGKAGNVALDTYVEVVQQNFRNSSFYPLATGLSGTLSTVGLQASGPIASGLAWQSRIAFARANDQSAFDSYKSFAGDVAFTTPGTRSPITYFSTGAAPTTIDVESHQSCRAPPL